MRGCNLAILFLAIVLLAGCGSPQAYYALDTVYLQKKAKQESADVVPKQVDDISVILTAMFGTPDDPFLPVGDTGLDELINSNHLRMAAGPVGSDEMGRPSGLYRQHCAHCHGVTGDGRGPTAAFLNPYPRDYRRGVYKFKSTPRGSRPTHEDLKSILINGVSGTAMPSFKLLPESEIEALIDYVKYLSIRGEVERLLVDETTAELDSEDRLIDDENLGDSSELLVEIFLTDVVQKWQQASSEITPVPARPKWENEQLIASIEEGKALFFGSVANCVSCHGPSQLGDGQVTDYDDWVKDYADDWIKEMDQKKKKKLLADLRGMGALEPRNIIPRNLRSGVYRGGRRPVDLYWRIHDGIDGTPMPAAMLKKPGQEAGLSSEDIWHLVNYVQSLPYESMATAGPDERVYMRPRM